MTGETPKQTPEHHSIDSQQAKEFGESAILASFNVLTPEEAAQQAEVPSIDPTADTLWETSEDKRTAAKLLARGLQPRDIPNPFGDGMSARDKLVEAQRRQDEQSRGSDLDKAA